MNHKNQKISLVIPVYNDADSLRLCLETIAGLDVKPFEVIVVDNNSTDGSGMVAAEYPFVRLVYEKKQGIEHARTCGFNAAKGDIIARIDADTLIPGDWLDKINALFARDIQLMAVSGTADYYDFILSPVANVIDRWARRYLTARLGNRLFLFGANMAIKKSAWDKIKNELCGCDGMHEDLDLGIHLQAKGMKVSYASDLVAGISSRRIGSGFRVFVKYCLASPKTYKAHALKRRFYMYQVILVVLALYAPSKIVYESYDPKLKAFSLRYLYDARLRKPRISPTINAG